MSTESLGGLIATSLVRASGGVPKRLSIGQLDRAVSEVVNSLGADAPDVTADVQAAREHAVRLLRRAHKLGSLEAALAHQEEAPRPSKPTKASAVAKVGEEPQPQGLSESAGGWLCLIIGAMIAIMAVVWSVIGAAAGASGAEILLLWICSTALMVCGVLLVYLFNLRFSPTYGIALGTLMVLYLLGRVAGGGDVSREEGSAVADATRDGSRTVFPDNELLQDSFFHSMLPGTIGVVIGWLLFGVLLAGLWYLPMALARSITGEQAPPVDRGADAVNDRLVRAAAAEAAGDWADARKLYEAVAAHEGHPNQRYAETCARELAAKMEQAGVNVG